ncbi:MAG TPA: type II secretion system protein [Kofleriaceae bacterium]|nr:type II secretion system protein [Kofleriaceae bacterium]
MRREAGFTLIEILIAVAIIGILVGLAVVGFSKQTRKARGAEANAMFAAIRTAQESYHLENGTYYSTSASEATTWPTTPVKTAQTILPLPAAWNTLRVRVSNDRVYCGYVTIAGVANSATGIGAMAQGFGLTTAPATDWFYILAKCDLDGSSTLDSYYFTWSGDTRVQKLNEGR